MEVAECEVLRYLGYRGAAISGTATGEQALALVGLIRELTAELKARLNLKSAFRIWGCRVESSATVLGGITINSKSLAEHLRDCHQAALLAATLGAEADSLIRRLSVQDMEKAVVVQAICSAMIEAYCAQIESEIARKADGEGLYATTRFSPGYGDFDIIHQKDILQMLSYGSHTGLTLTDGYMLIPSKSITAVVGLSRMNKRAKSVSGKCESCADERCAFIARIKETK